MLKLLKELVAFKFDLLIKQDGDDPIETIKNMAHYINELFDGDDEDDLLKWMFAFKDVLNISQSYLKFSTYDIPVEIEDDHIKISFGLIEKYKSIWKTYFRLDFKLNHKSDDYLPKWAVEDKAKGLFVDDVSNLGWQLVFVMDEFIKW